MPRGKIYCYLPNECYSDITTVGASLFINRCWAGHFSPFDTASLPQPFKETCDKKSFPLIILLANIQNCMGEFDITPRAISKSLKKYGNCYVFSIIYGETGNSLCLELVGDSTFHCFYMRRMQRINFIFRAERDTAPASSVTNLIFIFQQVSMNNLGALSVYFIPPFLHLQ